MKVLQCLFEPRTTEQWRQYFRHNAEHLRPIPWSLGVSFTSDELKAVTNSIREFQLGESSEGKHLIAQGKQYAQSSGDAFYSETLGLFIAEEHRHARDLGRVLDLAGIERAGHAWPDAIFRWLRHRAGLEVSIAVLVTAEIIAQVYYPALREATTSPVLRALCDQIIFDELSHVHFQCERLAILRRRRQRVSLAVRLATGQILFAGAIVVVWIQHGRVFRAGGCSVKRCWRDCWLRFNDAAKRMNPRLYSWPAKGAETSADMAADVAGAAVGQSPATAVKLDITFP